MTSGSILWLLLTRNPLSRVSIMDGGQAARQPASSSSCCQHPRGIFGDHLGPSICAPVVADQHPRGYFDGRLGPSIHARRRGSLIANQRSGRRTSGGTACCVITFVAGKSPSALARWFLFLRGRHPLAGASNPLPVASAGLFAHAILRGSVGRTVDERRVNLRCRRLRLG